MFESLIYNLVTIVDNTVLCNLTLAEREELVFSHTHKKAIYVRSGCVN